jgi:archaellum biogenesis ATPase FlaH
MRMSFLRDDPVAPPHNIEAEQAVIGSIMVTNRTIEAVRPILRPEHFFEPVHARIYAAALRHADAGRLADPITLKREFDADEGLRELGGAKYLAAMATGAQNIQTAAEYARIVQGLAFKRGLSDVADDLAHAARNGAAPLEAWAKAKAAFERLAPEHGGEGSARAQLMSAATWTREPPARRWTVEGWFPRREVTLLGGAGGAGKSLLVQQLLTSCAAQRSWLGMHSAAGAGLGMMCEDDAEELERRQHAIMRHHRLSPSDLGDKLHFWPRRGHVNTLMRFDPSGVPSTTALFEELLDLCRWKRPSVIVLDTAAHVFGGNENDRGQVTQFVCGCAQRLADEFDAAVVLCSHPSRSGIADGTGQSGSTGWQGSVRSRLYLKPAEGGGEDPLLCRMKANYAASSEELALRWSEGVLKTLPELTGAERPACGTVFIELLGQLRGQGRHVSHRPKANTYAPSVMCRMPDAMGYGAAELERTMELLFQSGRLRVGSYLSANRHKFEEIILVGG